MRWQWSEGQRVRHIVAAALFAALSIAMTWPLARNLGRAVAHAGDPFIVVWILDWDWWATLHQPLALFHANTFYPAKYSLAFSENLYGVALLLFPLRMLGVTAVSAFNVAMLAGFAFSGFAAYLLGWRLTRSWAAGLAAGVFYAFLPFRFVHLSHLQHVWGGWLPMLLFALLLYAEIPTRRRAALFAAVFVMNGLTNIHFLFFGTLTIAITAALLIPRESWRRLLIASVVAFAVLAPFLYPYLAVAKLYGMERAADEVARFSATAMDWLPHDGEPERRLYPGALALAVSAFALVIGRGTLQTAASRKLALLWIAIGFLGSLGFNTEFHTFLYGAVPGFRAIRVPARWAVIAYVGLAILIALATAALARRSRALAFLVPIAFVVTLWQAPIRWYLIDPDPSPVYTWLATQKLDGGVAELPMDAVASDYEAMLRATVHHKPIVNGVSGFAPPLRVELSALSNATPVPDAFIDRLREANVELMILHADLLGGHRDEVHTWLRRELDRNRIAFVGRFDTKNEGDWVFRIPTEGRGINAAERRGLNPAELDAFLGGATICGSSLMGALDFPGAAFTFRKSAIFSGWVVSRDGIRGVDLLFDNRRERFPARLQADPLLDARCAGVANVTRTRYVAVFDERPEDVSRETDVQVEVTDGRGRKTVFDHRWMTWMR